MRLPQPLRALEHQAYAALLGGAFISNVGTWMERVAVGVYVTALTGRAGWTGSVSAALFIPVVLVGPLGGALADRFERRRYLLWVTVVQAAIAAFVAFLAFAGALSIPALLILMALTGCASVMLSSAFNGLMAVLVPKDRLTSALFLNSGQWNLARLVGPMLAAPVIALGGVSWAFGLNTLSFFGVALAVWRMRIPPRSAASAAPPPLWEGLRGGLLAARGQPAIINALILVAFTGFLVAPFIGLAPAFAMKTLGRSEAQASLLTTFQGFGAVLCALAASTFLERIGHTRWLRVACLLLGPLTALYWASPSLAFASGSMVALGACYLAVVTSANTVILGRAPSGSHGRISSLYSSILDVTYALGLIAQGWLADAVGLRLVGVVGSAAFLVGVLGLMRLRPGLFESLQSRPISPADSTV